MKKETVLKTFASSYRTKQSILKSIWLLGTLLIFVLMFFPIFWMLSVSLRSNQEVFQFPPTLFPSKLHLQPYLAVLQDSTLLIGIRNSFVVSLATTFFSLGIALFASYGMSRYAFPGKKLLMFYILATQMIPIILITLPFYQFFLRIGLFDTIWGLMVAYISLSLPFCTLSLVGFMNTVPQSIDEAARIDGCSVFGAVLRIIIPVAKPGLVATGIFSFITAWNEYLFAGVLTISKSTRMLVVYIASKVGEYDINWVELMAVTIIASLPLILVYLFMQKSFMRGMTSGAIKM
ncbi:MAG: carbohydrate ABC transporter permease [Bacteroidetes bacterium]|nr:carbohydrate ABC transporter permease [Bacteroidota bacterium]